MPKLTKRLADGAEVRSSDYFLWDTDVPSFGLRIFASGRKSYLVQYRTGRRTRRVTIGKHGALTPDEARKQARQLLASIAKGENPAENLKRSRSAPTVSNLCDRFMSDHVEQHNKPKTAKNCRVLIRTNIRPKLGALKVADITRADISALHSKLKDTPYQANRTLAVLSKMFNLAEHWGWRPDGSNPCRHVKKYTEKRREKYLSPAEIARLGEVLREVERERSETDSAILAIRLLLLTGCRTGEILSLRWDYIQGNRIRLPDSKTGAKTIYLGPEAASLIANAPRLPDNPHVITGRRKGEPLTEIRHPWHRIRARAGLDDFRVHDLRHSFASIGVSNGESLPTIGKLLGHAQPQTTAQYAHLADDPTQGAAERISSRIAGLLEGDRRADHTWPG